MNETSLRYEITFTTQCYTGSIVCSSLTDPLQQLSLHDDTVLLMSTDIFLLSELSGARTEELTFLVCFFFASGLIFMKF